MATRAVHWHEGMFLRPQHFQASQRHLERQADRSARWDVHYNWGLRSLDLDLEALGNFRLVVRSLEARLRDGTVIAVPEAGILAERELRDPFTGQSNVMVYLGLPVVQLGHANAATGSPSDAVRYSVDTQELEDENTGANPQPVQTRQLNARLLLSTDDNTGYELLPIARLEKSQRAEATPQLDVAYVPPVLGCDAWKPLAAGILQAVYDRIGKKIDVLANQVTTRGLTFDSQAQGDPLIFAQLRELNEAQAVLNVLAFAQGVHPLTSYLELARIVGQLAIFGGPGGPPKSRYDHDDLGGCFYRLKHEIDRLLDIFVEPEYKERPFVGAGLRMQVSLEPVWLESTWSLFIGVQSPLDGGEVVRLLTKPGQLDMKVGGSDRVDDIFRMGQAGLRFAHTPTPPRALPTIPGQIYFQLNREAGGEWQNVLRSLTLALRLNEILVAGNIQGQRVLSIKTAGQATTMQFMLYVVPAGR